jgi:hypothetical protein
MGENLSGKLGLREKERWVEGKEMLAGRAA